MTHHLPPIDVRPTTPRDFEGIVRLTRAVYPDNPPWSVAQLESHLEVFPEGQLVAVIATDQRVVGMAASLVVTWDDYDHTATWREITESGTFRNHDPSGRTLYGAEVMVHPDVQRRRLGKRLYAARRGIAERHELLRIRAGARLRGYQRYTNRMTAEEYVLAVLHGEINGPTLSFQLREGFQVFAIVPGYLPNDAESLGWAALIEWLNPLVATEADHAARDPKWDVPQDHK
ncbi:MAG: GNAT family N-acetyltransferase [Gemmatimonadota bacterium]|nr:GNAT family N-acetyltransferase [Gemmatimonadota bacterium]MDH5198641.1 GNAT family N-acetyltransferase [Gemmatimonadota bacterium]